jgi:hypothetical protein
MTVKHRLFQDVMLSGCGLYSVHMLTAPLDQCAQDTSTLSQCDRPDPAGSAGG